MNGADNKINEVFATLAGQINEQTVGKVFQSAAIAMTNKVQRIHLLMQTTGGLVGDGVALYNYLRNLPMEIIAYNAGAVQSIGVITFLGAKKRKASKTATFMIHRTHFTSQIPTSSAQLQAVTDSIAIDDERTEMILRDHLTMPSDKWDVHNHANLVLTAEDALEYGLIDEIADFSPPTEATIFNIA